MTTSTTAYATPSSTAVSPPASSCATRELAAWLGVSRTPVREALPRLAEAGLVVAQPGRSTTVSPLDVRDVREARDVVAAMHELAVREAVGSLTEADLDAMREANAGSARRSSRATSKRRSVPTTSCTASPWRWPPTGP